MPRKPAVQRSAEEKYQIVLEGLKTGNVAETCRKHNIVPTQYYRWKEDAEKAAVAALGGEAQPRGPTKNRASVSGNWSVRWDVRTCRSRS